MSDLHVGYPYHRVGEIVCSDSEVEQVESYFKSAGVIPNAFEVGVFAGSSGEMVLVIACRHECVPLKSDVYSYVLGWVACWNHVRRQSGE